MGKIDILKYKTFVCSQDTFGSYESPSLSEALNSLKAKDRNLTDVEIAQFLSNAYLISSRTEQATHNLKLCLEISRHLHGEDHQLTKSLSRIIYRLAEVNEKFWR